MENISSRSLKKTSDQRKLRLLFQSLSDKIIKKSHFTTRHFGKIGVLVNFITQKLTSKHLAFSVFSGQRFFWENERKYFPHILGPNHSWFEFQSGHVFVFTGMLEQCKNDDQLATILGHEIAHSLLDHTVRFLKD